MQEITMEIFKYNFEGKTFKLTIRVNQLDCLLDFEIFDNEREYLNVKGLPVYKKRLRELIENIKYPERSSEIQTHNFMPHFNFGHQNKSYLLFNIQMIMKQGTLMGCLYDKDSLIANHFTINGIAGKELCEFMEKYVD